MTEKDESYWLGKAEKLLCNVWRKDLKNMDDKENSAVHYDIKEAISCILHSKDYFKRLRKKLADHETKIEQLTSNADATLRKRNNELLDEIAELHNKLDIAGESIEGALDHIRQAENEICDVSTEYSEVS
jgi:phage shock protein A